MKLAIVGERNVKYILEYATENKETTMTFRNEKYLLEHLEKVMPSLLWYDITKKCEIMIDDYRD